MQYRSRTSVIVRFLLAIPSHEASPFCLVGLGRRPCSSTRINECKRSDARSLFSKRYCCRLSVEQLFDLLPESSGPCSRNGLTNAYAHAHGIHTREHGTCELLSNLQPKATTNAFFNSHCQMLHKLSNYQLAEAFYTGVKVPNPQETA